MARLNWSNNASRSAISRWGSEQANPRDKTINSTWSRSSGGGKRPKPRSPHEVRHWSLRCEHCDHYGTIKISLIDLRAAVAAGRVHCQQCGTVRELLTCR